jgi:3-phosphoshikimate 1-carboxyvinyltransferase
MKFKKISSSKINLPILVPTSKSYANRAIILAAITKDKRIVSDIPRSSDVQEMIVVLKELLLLREYDGNEIVITKSFPEDEVISNTTKELYLGEGGTTIRFLLTMLALGKQKYRIKVHPRFKLRPYKDQLNILGGLGAKIQESNESDILCELQGPITLPEELTIDCLKTTQIASSFLLLKNKFNFEVKLINSNSSNAYVEMTKDLLQNSLKEVYKVPADFSSAGYFIALGLFLQRITLSNINTIDPFQADSKIFDVLDQINANYEMKNDLKVIPKDEYKTFFIDGSECLDLVPTLCFIAANIEGTSKILNIKNLIYKESDRLKGIENILITFGIKYKLLNDSIEIFGSLSKHKVNEVETLSDHRLIMMGSLFIKLNGGGNISPFEEVSKSFPNFFDILN